MSQVLVSTRRRLDASKSQNWIIETPLDKAQLATSSDVFKSLSPETKTKNLDAMQYEQPKEAIVSGAEIMEDRERTEYFLDNLPSFAPLSQDLTWDAKTQMETFVKTYLTWTPPAKGSAPGLLSAEPISVFALAMKEQWLAEVRPNADDAAKQEMYWTAPSQEIQDYFSNTIAQLVRPLQPVVMPTSIGSSGIVEFNWETLREKRKDDKDMAARYRIETSLVHERMQKHDSKTELPVYAHHAPVVDLDTTVSTSVAPIRMQLDATIDQMDAFTAAGWIMDQSIQYVAKLRTDQTTQLNTYSKNIILLDKAEQAIDDSDNTDVETMQALRTTQADLLNKVTTDEIDALVTGWKLKLIQWESIADIATRFAKIRTTLLEKQEETTDAVPQLASAFQLPIAKTHAVEYLFTMTFDTHTYESLSTHATTVLLERRSIIQQQQAIIDQAVLRRDALDRTDVSYAADALAYNTQITTATGLIGDATTALSTLSTTVKDRKKWMIIAAENHATTNVPWISWVWLVTDLMDSLFVTYSDVAWDDTELSLPLIQIPALQTSYAEQVQTWDISLIAQYSLREQKIPAAILSSGILAPDQVWSIPYIKENQEQAEKNKKSIATEHASVVSKLGEKVKRIKTLADQIKEWNTSGRSELGTLRNEAVALRDEKIQLELQYYSTQYESNMGAYREIYVEHTRANSYLKATSQNIALLEWRAKVQGQYLKREVSSINDIATQIKAIYATSSHSVDKYANYTKDVLNGLYEEYGKAYEKLTGVMIEEGILKWTQSVLIIPTDPTYLLAWSSGVTTSPEGLVWEYAETLWLIAAEQVELSQWDKTVGYYTATINYMQSNNQYNLLSSKISVWTQALKSNTDRQTTKQAQITQLRTDLVAKEKELTTETQGPNMNWLNGQVDAIKAEIKYAQDEWNILVDRNQKLTTKLNDANGSLWTIEWVLSDLKGKRDVSRKWVVIWWLQPDKTTVLPYETIMKIPTAWKGSADYIPRAYDPTDVEYEALDVTTPVAAPASTSPWAWTGWATTTKPIWSATASPKYTVESTTGLSPSVKLDITSTNTLKTLWLDFAYNTLTDPNTWAKENILTIGDGWNYKFIYQYAISENTSIAESYYKGLGAPSYILSRNMGWDKTDLYASMTNPACSDVKVSSTPDEYWRYRITLLAGWMIIGHEYFHKQDIDPWALMLSSFQTTMTEWWNSMVSRMFDDTEFFDYLAYNRADNSVFTPSIRPSFKSAIKAKVERETSWYELKPNFLIAWWLWGFYIDWREFVQARTGNLTITKEGSLIPSSLKVTPTSTATPKPSSAPTTPTFAPYAPLWYSVLYPSMKTEVKSADWASSSLSITPKLQEELKKTLAEVTNEVLDDVWRSMQKPGYKTYCTRTWTTPEIEFAKIKKDIAWVKNFNIVLFDTFDGAGTLARVKKNQIIDWVTGMVSTNTAEAIDFNIDMSAWVVISKVADVLYHELRHITELTLMRNFDETFGSGTYDAYQKNIKDYVFENENVDLRLFRSIETEMTTLFSDLVISPSISKYADRTNIAPVEFWSIRSTLQARIDADPRDTSTITKINAFITKYDNEISYIDRVNYLTSGSEAVARTWELWNYFDNNDIPLSITSIVTLRRKLALGTVKGKWFDIILEWFKGMDDKLLLVLQWYVMDESNTEPLDVWSIA